MNPLNDHPRARKVAYYFQFVVAGVLLLLGVGYGAAEADIPKWYVVAAAVANAAWAYLGLTAAQNVPSLRDAVEGQVPPGEVNRIVDEERGLTVAELCLLVIAVIAVLGFLVWIGAFR